MFLEPEKRIPTGNNNKYDIVRNNGGKKKIEQNLWSAITQKLYNTVNLEFYIQLKKFPKLWLNKNIFR